MDLAFEFAEPTCAFTLAPRQSDVRMVRTSLGDKPAKASRSGDALLKSLEFGGEIDTRKENTSAIEEAQPLQLNRNGRRAQFAKPADYAFVLRGITQKLQGNMPRFRSGPAQAVRMRLKAHRDRRQFLHDHGGKWNPNKKPHTSLRTATAGGADRETAPGFSKYVLARRRWKTNPHGPPRESQSCGRSAAAIPPGSDC